jgi:glutaredoxin 3
MAKVEIYTTEWCPYCVRAKRLLSTKGIDFEEIDVGYSADKKQEMMRRADGRHPVPQVFIDGAGVGGSDELAALERAGKLDAMLGTAS